MDVDGVWTLGDRTRAEAERDGGESVVERHSETLREALEPLVDDEVRAFDLHLRRLRGRANDWVLWAAGYLALGGMSDDSFLDFRTWLITHGRATYERVLAEPDGVADLSWDEGEEDFGAAEEWGYVAIDLLEHRGSDEAEDDGEPGDFDEPSGEPF